MIRLPEREPFDYQFARVNAQWADHRLRVRITAEMIAWLEPKSLIDPACGDGSIVKAANELHPIENMFLSDLSAPNVEALNDGGWLRLVAFVENADAALNGLHGEPRDVVVLTEILEHIEDPAGLLKLARSKAKCVVASSPLFDEDAEPDTNPEHLWMFSARGYHDMLVAAGWTPMAFVPLYFDSIYDFQIWVAR